MNEYEPPSPAQATEYPEFAFLTTEDCEEFLVDYENSLAEDYYQEARRLYLSGEFTHDEQGWQQILEIAWPRAKANNAIGKKMAQRSAERGGLLRREEQTMAPAALDFLPLPALWKSVSGLTASA